MQRIVVETTEREAYETYLKHLGRRWLAPFCGCRPSLGALCPEGTRLHSEWRAAEEREHESGEAVARGFDVEVHDRTPRDELFLRLDEAEDEE